MTEQSKAILKGYFDTGDVPIQSNFTNLIDSFALQSQVDSLIVAGGNVATTLTQEAASGATTLNVVSTTDFITTAYVGYIRQDSVYEERQITVASGTALTVAATGGIISNGEIIAMLPTAIRAAAEEPNIGAGVAVTLPSRVEYLAGTYTYHPRAHGAIGDGSTDDRAILNTLLNTTMSSGGVVFIDRTYRIASNLTVPAGVTLEFARNGKISVDSAQTLTINGGVQAGLYQIFSGSGSVASGGTSTVPQIYPQWFGAKGDVRQVTDGAMTATLFTLTSATAAFVAADQGKTIVVRGAKTGGYGLRSTIATVDSATQVTLAAAAGVTVSGATVTLGSDDTAEIQAALSAAAAGQTIYIPDGDYFVDVDTGLYPLSNTNLILSQSAVLRAISSDQVGYQMIRLWQSGSSPIIGVDNVVISGGKIMGEVDDHGAALDQAGYGIVGRRATNIVVADMIIQDCMGDGITFYCGSQAAHISENITVRGCTIRDNYRNNGSIMGGRHITFIDCRFVAAIGWAPQAGFDVEPYDPGDGDSPCQHIAFLGCHFYGNERDGLRVYNADHVTVDGCTFYDNGAAGPNGSGIWLSDALDVAIIGCILRANVGTGIYLEANSTRISIVGCVINGTTASYGIGLVAASGVQIVGCLVHANQDYGISIANSSDIVLIGNRVSNTAAAGFGIFVSGTSQRVMLEANHLYNNVHGCYFYAAVGWDGHHNVIGNYAYANTSYGIYLTNQQQCNLRGNHVYRNALAGIFLEDGRDCAIDGNYAADNSQTTDNTRAGIEILGDYNGIRGNTVRVSTYAAAGATVSFVAATKKITDSANGLANFKAGNTIVVSGTVSNNGTYTVVTGGDVASPLGAELVTTQALVNESNVQATIRQKGHNVGIWIKAGSDNCLVSDNQCRNGGVTLGIWDAGTATTLADNIASP